MSTAYHENLDGDGSFTRTDHNCSKARILATAQTHKKQQNKFELEKKSNLSAKKM